MWRNWSFPSTAIPGNFKKSQAHSNPSTYNAECSDDEGSTCSSREEGLECPICWESFNIVENVPYVLWCGHTLCKNCVLGLQWAIVKFTSAPIQLPLFISCPWCNLLSFRLVYKGNLKFPRKNFFLLWMVENMNRDRTMTRSSSHGEHHQPTWSQNHHHNNIRRVPHIQHQQQQQRQPRRITNGENQVGSYLNAERINASLRKSLAFFVHLTAKFPLVIFFLLIVLYAIPASAAILALYILITILFALPSFLMLYFAYPSLDWLIREIVT